MSSILVACGEVGSGNPDGAPPIDAPAAAMGEVIIAQTNSNEVTGGFGCASNTTPKYIREQSFYRAFTLADYNIRGAYRIRKVTFGIYSSTAGAPATTQPVDVSIYSYAGAVGGQTVDLGQMVKIGTTRRFNLQNIATPTAGTVDMTADVPAGTTAIAVELHVADGLTAMHQLSIGTNMRGESKPGYQRAPGCNFPNPVTLATAGLPNSQLVLSVTGDAL